MRDISVTNFLISSNSVSYTHLDVYKRQGKDSEDTFFITAEQLEEAMQKVMDQYAGGIATDYQYNEERLVIGKKRIGELLGMIDELKAKDMFELKDIYEVRERLIVCQTLIEHLRARKETRWHSFGENTDYPEESNQWLKYVNSKRKPDGGTEIIFRELVTGGKDVYKRQIHEFLQPGFESAELQRTHRRH